ncbi:hypothetical protein F5X96DRAFT_685564 [Biscogniauxia mediterranea]|nr:hypothetical protein F5X96DRAFT_685564 [Biscogniauxia mediterranea]
MKLHTLFLAFNIVQTYQTRPPLPNEFLNQQCISNSLGPLDPEIGVSSCPLVVDDETAFERRSWHPWTFPPACMKAENDAYSKLCTFTYANLRGEAGVSIITTPEIAAAGREFLEDMDPRWAVWEGDHIHTASMPPPYEVKGIEGKGLGVIASRHIRQGEIIMAQYPVILRMIDIEPWKYQDVLNLLHRAAMQLPTKEKAAMLALARSKGGYIVDDIMNTNSYSVVFNRVSSTTLAMEIVAYRDINEGEELTTSYTPLNLLSDQRQPLIREWGFNCTCTLCASRKERETSDRRRTEMQRLLEELDEPRFQHHSAISERVDKILDLCDEEGLMAQVGDFYAIVADVYYRRGDLESAERYGKMAVDELRYYAGYDHERTRNAIAFLEEIDARQ